MCPSAQELGLTVGSEALTKSEAELRQSLPLRGPGVVGRILRYIERGFDVRANREVTVIATHTTLVRKDDWITVVMSGQTPLLGEHPTTYDIPATRDCFVEKIR